jgi:hypothetical protein
MGVAWKSNRRSTCGNATRRCVSNDKPRRSSWRARDELIEKRLVTRQLAYVLIPFRQAVAAIPSKMRRQLGEPFTHEMLLVAWRIAAETLETLSRLPEAVEPGWQEQLEEVEK